MEIHIVCVIWEMNVVFGFENLEERVCRASDKVGC
jgi:hypothetical protein